MKLKEHIKRNFPGNIEFPLELEMFCDWVEQNPSGYFVSGFELTGIEEQVITSYFESGKFGNKIALFAHSGNGGLFGIWKNGGKQYFIHLGSEGDEWYILADNPVDFLRLLAIGYHDVVGEDWNEKPSEPDDGRFAGWVEKTFQTKVPETGSGIADKQDRRFAEWIYETLQPEETFEHFDPDNPLSWESYYGRLKVWIISVPPDRKAFLAGLRTLSGLGIGELMGKLKDLPFVILEEMCFIRGPLNIKNLSGDLAINLEKLKRTYPDSLKISFKERSIADCADYDKYPLGAKVNMPETSDFIELE